jgi:hypothetical protein
MADPGPRCYLPLAGRMLAAPDVGAGGRGAALALMCGLLQAGPELLGQVGIGSLASSLWLAWPLHGHCAGCGDI